MTMATSTSGSSQPDTRAELAELIKRKTEIGVGFRTTLTHMHCDKKSFMISRFYAFYLSPIRRIAWPTLSDRSMRSKGATWKTHWLMAT